MGHSCRLSRRGLRARYRATGVNERVLGAPEQPAPRSGGRLLVSREEISKLAYSYWEARGYAGGSAEEDWLRAEGELRAQRERH
jgi:hypothetical protein